METLWASFYEGESYVGKPQGSMCIIYTINTCKKPLTNPVSSKLRSSGRNWLEDTNSGQFTPVFVNEKSLVEVLYLDIDVLKKLNTKHSQDPVVITW